jgi:hypothetical protein
VSVLPPITKLLVSRIEDAINWAEVIVITASDPIYANGLANLPSDQVILDFAGIAPAGEEALHLYFHERGTLQWPEGIATDPHKPKERCGRRRPRPRRRLAKRSCPCSRMGRERADATMLDK